MALAQAFQATAIRAANRLALDHPIDVGPNYLVMEFIEGAPVAPPDSPRKLLDMAVRIADGLAAAHAAGIIHRDLKPDNILMTREGRIKIHPLEVIVNRPALLKKGASVE